MSAPLTASESAVMNWKPLKERMNCTSWYSSYKDEARLETKSVHQDEPAAAVLVLAVDVSRQVSRKCLGGV